MNKTKKMLFDEKLLNTFNSLDNENEEQQTTLKDIFNALEELKNILTKSATTDEQEQEPAKENISNEDLAKQLEEINAKLKGEEAKESPQIEDDGDNANTIALLQEIKELLLGINDKLDNKEKDEDELTVEEYELEDKARKTRDSLNAFNNIIKDQEPVKTNSFEKQEGIAVNWRNRMKGSL